ncbi:MAG TPA: DUF4416 family protein [Acidobacteriota bacterium]|nr:DUF4416 family protein [Acidobacteriota bacterium]
MAETSAAKPVKLFVVTLHRDPAILKQAIDRLIREWGDSDFVSQGFPFSETAYYEPEMGPNLIRRFYSFARLIAPDSIVEAKLLTNRIETELIAGSTGRTINLDPGYLDTYKVVLASAKFGGQKVYLRDGIYADMTLIRNHGRWESFAWGFPDFKSGKYDDVLNQIVTLFKNQTKA